ncbi:MAG: biotin--[acetyl-CoA-carboxylase] ligase [Phycisphaerae bacterium]|nr:biotin--[acetyl-CoA-carboxylase] ligase [Phycisphaerae bacterium]
MIPDSPHVLSADAIAAELHTARVGRRVAVLPEIDSTNTFALQTLAPQSGADADGTAVFAERQTAGRGRLGRQWHSPAGASVMCTILLNEPRNAARPAFWMTGAAVAVARTIERTTDVSPQIIWPNDIYVGEKKLAGILVEAKVTGCSPETLDTHRVEVLAPREIARRDQRSSQFAAWIAIGIGINCLQQPMHFPEPLRACSTSLHIESRDPIDRLAIARRLLRELDGLFAEPACVSDDELTAEWCRRSADIGRRVTLISGQEHVSGVILDIHPRDGLVLQPDVGSRRHFDPATTSRA